MQGNDHETIDRLLPWFVNRTLEPGEHDRVQRHVDGCDACRESVSLLSAVESTLRNPTATPLVPAPRAHRLLEAIDRDGREYRRRPRRFARTAIAASLAAAILAAAALLPDTERTQTPPALYETATSDTRPAPMDYVFDIRFERGTPPAARERVLHDLGARDVSASGPDGAYRVTVRLSAASLEDLQDYVRELESSPGVASADVVALQLPLTGPQ